MKAWLQPRNGPGSMHQSPEETRTTSLSFALIRNARYYLRASNQTRESLVAAQKRTRMHASIARRDPGDLIVVRINPECPLLLKGIEPRSSKTTWTTPQWGRGKRQSVASGRPSHLTSFAFHPSAGLRKSPSNRWCHRHGTAYHRTEGRTISWPLTLDGWKPMNVIGRGAAADEWCRVGGGRLVVPR